MDAPFIFERLPDHRDWLEVNGKLVEHSDYSDIGGHKKRLTGIMWSRYRKKIFCDTIPFALEPIKLDCNLGLIIERGLQYYLEVALRIV